MAPAGPMMPSTPATQPPTPGMPGGTPTGPTMPTPPPDPRTIPPTGPQAAQGEVAAVPAVPAGADEVPAGAASSAQEGDWLDRICPYLLSRDGTYRSSQPDADHRCTAVDPPSTLPLAFQERFCLSERHVRCEMYKVAQSARSAALDQEGIPADQVRSARFRPSVRSVPLALGPASGTAGAPGGGSRRPLVIAAIAIGLIAVLVFAVAMVLGGGGGTGPDPSPTPAVLGSPSPEPTRTTPPSVGPSQPGETAAPSSASPSGRPAAAGPLIEYEVQEGEALIAIAETFGTTRRDILLANPEMAGQRPYTEPGDIIIVPVSADMAPADIEAAPGFVRYLE